MTATTKRPAEFRALTSRINFAEFKSDEHADWRTHRDAYKSVPRGPAGFRGCIGLGLLVDRHAVDADDFVWAGSTLVPDSAMRWLSVVDVPFGRIRTDHRTRPHVQWATSRTTSSRFGMPSLAFGDEEHCFDLLAFPFSETTVRDDSGDRVTVRPPAHTLDAAAYPQLFRAFNAIQWAMTTYAAAYMPAWFPARRAVANYIGVRHYPRNIALLKFGGDVYDGVAEPSTWMPTALVGFPDECLHLLFGMATRSLSPHAGPVPPYSFSVAVADALGRHLAYTAPFDGIVKEIVRGTGDAADVVTVRLSGDCGEEAPARFAASKVKLFRGVGDAFKTDAVVAAEPWLSAGMSSKWATMSLEAKLAEVWKVFPGGVANPAVRHWFDRQAVCVQPGVAHFPSSLVSCAAMSSAVDGRILWDLGQPTYFDDTSDCYVWPTLPISNWHELQGWLPGDIAFDFTPRHPEFESPNARWERVRRGRAAGKRKPGGAKE